MKHKLFKVVLIILIIASVLISAVACSARVDEERNTVKPDIRLVLDNYQALGTKKSELNGKVIIKLFGQPAGKDKDVVIYTVGQEAILSRILNDGTTYMDGKLRSCNVSENVTMLVSLIAEIINAKDNDKVSMLAYLKGHTYYTMNMGHKDGNYNLKTTYHNERLSQNHHGRQLMMTVLMHLLAIII